jgi:hypothetical protein
MMRRHAPDRPPHFGHTAPVTRRSETMCGEATLIFPVADERTLSCVFRVQR